MGGSASTRRIAPRANQPPCLLEPVTAEVCKLARRSRSTVLCLPSFRHLCFFRLWVRVFLNPCALAENVRSPLRRIPLPALGHPSFLSRRTDSVVGKYRRPP